MKRNLKKIFLTGLAVVVPVVLTLYILSFLITIMDSLFLVIPAKYQPAIFHIPGLGAIATVILIFICGLVTRSLVGKRLVILGEGLLDKIPIVRSIYQAVKQVSDSMFMDKNKSFKKVVLIRFPTRDSYSIAFVTGIPSDEFKGKIGGERSYVGVFMPTAPNPTTGLYMIMPEDELIYLDVSVEEAFTLVISTGIVTTVERNIDKAVCLD